MRKILLLFLFLIGCSASEIGGGDVPPTGLSIPQTPLTILETSQLIGGPAAQGRVGDVLLSNSKIRVIIQKPSKSAGIGSFGGNIIDADWVRPKGEGGDQWGEIFSLVNIEWTVNYHNYEILSDGKDGGPQILRAYGVIDVYDYLDLDWIADAATAAIGQQVFFDDQFDDRRDPFSLHPELQDLSFNVVTEYRLDPNATYVKIDTTFSNPSNHPIHFPVGDFLVPMGELQLLIPGLGFSPTATSQVGENTPAVLFQAFPGNDVSYGYFYDPSSFVKPQTDEETEEKKEVEYFPTSSVTYAGLTGVLLGEQFLKILPLGSHTSPEIHFSLPSGGERTLTRYFVVGGASSGSLLDVGLKVLKIPTMRVSGVVLGEGGKPAASATVAIKKVGGGTVAAYVANERGEFEGLLPKGEGILSRWFGVGPFEAWVEKRGYHQNGTLRAGSCNPSGIDPKQTDSIHIICKLGEAGFVSLASGVIDAETGESIPARLTIIGEDPSPETKGAGTFSDLEVFYKPFGIVDSLFINAKGGIGLSEEQGFHLEPATYRFFFSHGPEYSVVEKEVVVSAGETLTLDDIQLKRVVKTPGFISADFHIHALPSADSAFSVERRALAAVADGLDVLHSSDHDFLTDYGPVVKKLVKLGILNDNSVQTIVGDEITPNHYGHLHAFPLVPDFEDVDHGAIDWSSHPLDLLSPAPDYVLSPPQIIEKALQDPGEEVIQVNHIADSVTGLPVACGWLTTPVYENTFQTPAFVSFADPIERRLEMFAKKNPLPPYPSEVSPLIFDMFTAMELAVGPDMRTNGIWESAFPTWFNLLNLGLLPTATANSDSHHEIHMPLGMPRNYVATKVDPKDGFDEEAYAHAINERKVVVSAGPFISITAMNEEGDRAGVGELISGKTIQFEIEISSPDWAWFDTVEIYTNTEPIPAEDTGRFAMRKEASNPEEFAKPYHIPHYVYEPSEHFKLSDGTLTDWKMEKGLIRAYLKLQMTVKEDTWFVVVAKGTPSTKGYRSLFPIVPDVLIDKDKEPQNFDLAQLEKFHNDPLVGAEAWGFTNPIFIDVDGDTDGDGFSFEAKWVREGRSHLKPFHQELHSR